MDTTEGRAALYLFGDATVACEDCRRLRLPRPGEDVYLLDDEDERFALALFGARLTCDRCGRGLSPAR